MLRGKWDPLWLLQHLTWKGCSVSVWCRLHHPFKCGELREIIIRHQKHSIFGLHLFTALPEPVAGSLTPPSWGLGLLLDPEPFPRPCLSLYPPCLSSTPLPISLSLHLPPSLRSMAIYTLVLLEVSACFSFSLFFGMCSVLRVQCSALAL